MGTLNKVESMRSSQPPCPGSVARSRREAISQIFAVPSALPAWRDTSPAPAHHVLVRNSLPPNAKFVTAIPKPAAVEPAWTSAELPDGL